MVINPGIKTRLSSGSYLPRALGTPNNRGLSGSIRPGLTPRNHRGSHPTPPDDGLQMGSSTPDRVPTVGSKRRVA